MAATNPAVTATARHSNQGSCARLKVESIPDEVRERQLSTELSAARRATRCDPRRVSRNRPGREADWVTRRAAAHLTEGKYSLRESRDKSRPAQVASG